MTQNNIMETDVTIPCQSHCAKNTIYKGTTMPATFKNVLFPGHNYLLTTGIDYLTLWLSPEHQQVKGHQYRWLAGGYDLDIGQF